MFSILTIYFTDILFCYGLFFCLVGVQDLPAWRALQAHYDTIGSKLNMDQLFKDDPNRFDKFK